MSRVILPCIAILTTMCLVSAACAQNVNAHGIYVLGNDVDNPNTPLDERITGIRDYDFVSGLTLRTHWSDLNPSAGQYDFGVIDQALSRLAPLGQKMRLHMQVWPAPQYVLDQATQLYTDNLGNTVPVPWDAAQMQAYSTFMTALSNHVVAGTGQRLADDPTLVAVSAYVPGFSTGVRDSANLVNSSGYTRQATIDAVTANVAASRNAFPTKAGDVFFFGYNDGTFPRADQLMIAELAATYNGPGQPTLRFGVENLSDNYPTTKANDWTGQNLLTWRDLGGETMMQALWSWQKPNPIYADCLTSGNPSTGIAMAHNTFGTQFFELYIADIDAAKKGAVDAAGQPLLPGLRYWNAVLNPFRWTGLAAEGNIDIGAAGNWDAETLAPPRLIFAASNNGKTTVANECARTVGTVTFDAAGYDLGGTAPLSVTVGVTANQSARICAPLVLTGGGQLAAADGATLAIDGPVGGANGLTKQGAGVVQLAAGENTYTGNTLVEEGTLIVAAGVNSNGNAAMSDDTIVGTASATATLITSHIRQDTLTINAGSRVSIDTAVGSSATSVVNFLRIANGLGGFSWDEGPDGLASADFAAPSDRDTVSQVPEPATWLLLMLAGLAGALT